MFVNEGGGLLRNIVLNIAIFNKRKTTTALIKSYCSDSLRIYQRDSNIDLFYDIQNLIDSKKFYNLIFISTECHQTEYFKAISSLNNSYKTKIIIITSEIEQIVEFIKLSPYRIILFPICFAEINEIIESVIQKLGSKSVVLNQENKLYSVPIKNIDYISSCGNFTQVITNNETFSSNLTLKKWQEVLFNYSQFKKIHKSFIVNMDKIVSVNKESVSMKNLKELPISVRQRKSTKEEFIKYIEK